MQYYTCHVLTTQVNPHHRMDFSLCHSVWVCELIQDVYSLHNITFAFKEWVSSSHHTDTYESIMCVCVGPGGRGGWSRSCALKWMDRVKQRLSRKLVCAGMCVYMDVSLGQFWNLICLPTMHIALK